MTGTFGHARPQGEGPRLRDTKPMGAKVFSLASGQHSFCVIAPNQDWAIEWALDRLEALGEPEPCIDLVEEVCEVDAVLVERLRPPRPESPEADPAHRYGYGG